MPLAYLAHHAGGAASTGKEPIGDLQPTLLHQRVALFVAVKLLQAGLAAFLHSIVPCLFERTAGNMIRELHTTLERR